MGSCAVGLQRWPRGWLEELGTCCSGDSHLYWQLQFSDVLTRWRRFFHQMAAEQGQAGRAAVDTKLEVVVLQVSGPSPSPGTVQWSKVGSWRCWSVAGVVGRRKKGNRAAVGILNSSMVYKEYGWGGVGSWLSR